MDQKAIWNLLRARWITIFLIGLLGTALAASYAYLAPREYTAESEIFVTADQSDNASELAQGSNFSQQQARNYSVVATREVVLAPVIDKLDLDMSVAALARHVSTSVPLNTSLISVSVTDEAPERAAAIADEISATLTSVVTQLVPKRTDGTSPVRLETVQSAAVPTFPSSPNVRLLLVLGLVLGLAGGIAFVVLREVVSAKIRLPEQVRQIAGPTVLGTLAVDKGTSVQPMLTGDDTLSLRAEEFRQIRTNLRFLQTGEGHKAFAITSSIPGEGKSTTAANLAAAAAATGARVCLVEADLRKPALGGYLDLESAVGLTTVLANEIKLDDAMQEWGEDGLQVLLAGEIPPNPSELLGSRQMEQLLTNLRRKFEIVILDCPPLMPVTDAAVIGRFVKGVILVVGTGTVEVRELRNSVETLNVAGVPVLGTILNRMPVRHASRYQQPYVLPEPKKAKRRLFATAGNA